MKTRGYQVVDLKKGNPIDALGTAGFAGSAVGIGAGAEADREHRHSPSAARGSCRFNFENSRLFSQTSAALKGKRRALAIQATAILLADHVSAWGCGACV